MNRASCLTTKIPTPTALCCATLDIPTTCSTDSDTALAKLSAVQKQYHSDPYFRYFVTLEPTLALRLSVGSKT